MLWIQIWIGEYLLLFWKIAYMNKALQSFMFETGSLGTIHTVNVPFQSMANGFQSEVRFAHAVDILFVSSKFMYLT